MRPSEFVRWAKTIASEDWPPSVQDSPDLLALKERVARDSRRLAWNKTLCWITSVALVSTVLDWLSVILAGFAAGAGLLLVGDDGVVYSDGSRAPLWLAKLLCFLTALAIAWASLGWSTAALVGFGLGAGLIWVER